MLQMNLEAMSHINGGDTNIEHLLLMTKEGRERAKESVRSIRSRTTCRVARKTEESGSTPNRSNATKSARTVQDGRSQPRNRNPSIKKRGPANFNASISSISELEPVISFNESESLNMSSLSYLAGSNDSSQLLLFAMPPLAQGPSSFETAVHETARMAPKMPTRGLSESNLNCGNDSNGSLLLDDIIEETTNHSCTASTCADTATAITTNTTTGRPWSEGAGDVLACSYNNISSSLDGSKSTDSCSSFSVCSLAVDSADPV